jgi:hypothetical protein
MCQIHNPGQPRTPVTGLGNITGILADAPARIKEALLAAFQVQALYNNDDDQATIRSTLTADPPAPSHSPVSHLESALIPQVAVHDQ